MAVVEATFATSLGFSVYFFLTHPKKLKGKVPNIGKGAIQIIPNLKINFKSRTIWIHHWIWMSITLVFINQLASGLENLFYLKFFTFGAILQGFSFKDRFNILVRQEKQS